MKHEQSSPSHSSDHSEHYVLPDKTAVLVGGALLCLTAITVAVAHVDFGALNFLIAMTVATIKALFVALVFMNLRHDTNENRVVFGTSFLFLVIFFVLTGFDVFYRHEPAVSQALLGGGQNRPSQFKKAWIRTPELVAHGKPLFVQQCVSCHGTEGKGDGAAAAALTPKPRNFTIAEGWKNGRKPSQVFKTLKEGIPGSAMGSFASLSADDRWGLIHYVLSLGPTPGTDSTEDLMKVGIDPSKDASESEAQKKSLPIEFILERMIKEFEKRS